MVLTGSYRRALDEKFRVAIPKQMREKLGEQVLFVAPAVDGAIVVYTAAVLDEVGETLKRLSPAASEARSFSRLFYSQVTEVELDRQGRLRIPPELTKLAGLKQEIMIVGIRDRIEIWDVTVWGEFLKSTQPSYDRLAENVFKAAFEQTRD